MLALRTQIFGCEGQSLKYYDNIKKVHEAITAQTVSSMHTARAFNGGMQMTSEDGSEGFESIEEQIVIVRFTIMYLRFKIKIPCGIILDKCIYFTWI